MPLSFSSAVNQVVMKGSPSLISDTSTRVPNDGSGVIACEPVAVWDLSLSDMMIGAKKDRVRLALFVSEEV
jgi:hypothetical protein